MRPNSFAAMVLAAILTTSAMPLAAAVELPPLAARWYDALVKVDRDAFARLLAEDAKIDLRQLAVVQSREEFIEALDNWQEAVKGTTIQTRPVSADTANAVIEVCYRFPSNQRLNRETFVFAGDKIASQTQELLGESCQGF